MYKKICTRIIVHIILLILGELWSKESNFTSLLLVKVFVGVADVNTKALNIKFCRPQQKHCWGKANAKCIFIKLPWHFICHSKKCWNLRAAYSTNPLNKHFDTKFKKLLKILTTYFLIIFREQSLRNYWQIWIANPFF